MIVVPRSMHLFCSVSGAIKENPNVRGYLMVRGTALSKYLMLLHEYRVPKFSLTSKSVNKISSDESGEATNLKFGKMESNFKSLCF